MSTHAKAAAKFLADRERAAWHDRALYHVREKRDRMAHAVPEWEALRQAASEIKLHTLSHLGRYLEEFERNATANGMVVHWASDAREMNRIVLDILRRQREQSTAFSALPKPADDAAVCVYVELDCESEEQATEQLYRLGDVLTEAGGDESSTWVARTEVDRERLIFFRHAVLESVNMLIDQRRRTDPTITKLGSDMSVPDERLHDVFALYRRTLAEAGLESAAWGHIGNNHIHVNVLPRDAADFRAGGELFAGWAAEATRMGGAVSAEHGVGKIKAGFLATMYGPDHIAESARLKAELDPKGQLGRGNLFGEDVLEAAMADVARGRAQKGGE